MFLIDQVPAKNPVGGATKEDLGGDDAEVVLPLVLIAWSRYGGMRTVSSVGGQALPEVKADTKVTGISRAVAIGICMVQCVCICVNLLSDWNVMLVRCVVEQNNITCTWRAHSLYIFLHTRKRSDCATGCRESFRRLCEYAT